MITLIFLTALSTVSLNMFLPSLAGITTDLGTSYAVASFAVAGYLAVTAVLQLVLGPLSDRIGRRPVLLFALGTFAMASVGCAFATDIRVFLGFRMLQGGVIAGYALSLAIVRDTTSEQKAAGLIGYISMAMALAPMVGPVLGGILDTTFGWRANFVFYALAGIALFVLCWVDLGETKSAQVPRSGTDAAKVLLKVPLFWAYALCSAFSTGAFYIFLTGAPLVAAQEFGVSTA
ncbi:MAG: MFS transporter, partial [Pseudomonadota bacterium]